MEIDMDLNNVKQNILELCSESEYGSWEFWSSKETKTVEEMEKIFQALVNLYEEECIKVLEHKDNDFYEVPLDLDRLKTEIQSSMQFEDIKPESFYWFEATEEGKRIDLKSRKNKIMKK